MLGRLVSASGLAPSLPGRKWIFKLNCDRNSDHLACCLVSFLVEVKYSRFLWSITVLMAVAKPSKKCCQDLNALNIARAPCHGCHSSAQHSVVCRSRRPLVRCLHLQW